MYLAILIFAIVTQRLHRILLGQAKCNFSGGFQPAFTIPKKKKTPGVRKEQNKKYISF